MRIESRTAWGLRSLLGEAIQKLPFLDVASVQMRVQAVSGPLGLVHARLCLEKT